MPELLYADPESAAWCAFGAVLRARIDVVTAKTLRATRAVSDFGNLEDKRPVEAVKTMAISR